MTDLAETLSEPERDASWPNQRPRDAATIILIDRAEHMPKVLLGRRHHGHKFVPNKFVFPGGRVEPKDRHVAVTTRLDPRVEKRLMAQLQRPSPIKARAFAVAAIREVFEETGIMLGERVTDRPKLPDGPWAEFAEKRVQPDLGALHFIARAITPPRRPKRFDTRFFAIDSKAIAYQIDGVVGPDSELVEMVWLPIVDAKRLDIPAITRVVLTELEARIASGFTHERPVPFHRMRHGRFVRDYL